MRRVIQHAWGTSDRALVISLAEKKGWVLDKESSRSPGFSNRKHYELEFLVPEDYEPSGQGVVGGG